MAKFCGKVGYGQAVETEPGIHEDVIVEREYYGDVVRNTRALRAGENLLPNISVNNSIEIVADAYAREHFFAIKYVVWSGVRWTVSEVEERRPRLVLRLGEVYNGPTPAGVAGSA